MFRALYNEIEYLKVYFSHIQSPPIQQRFKAEILHPIEEFQVNVMQGIHLVIQRCISSPVRGESESRHSRSPKGKFRINLDDFDVDLFVAHAEEWRRHLPVIREQFLENFSNGKLHPLGTHMYELQNLSYAVGHALAANLTGRLKKSWRFIENTEIVLREIGAY
jgi:hypothetical protein